MLAIRAVQRDCEIVCHYVVGSAGYQRFFRIGASKKDRKLRSDFANIAVNITWMDRIRVKAHPNKQDKPDSAPLGHVYMDRLW